MKLTGKEIIEKLSNNDEFEPYHFEELTYDNDEFGFGLGVAEMVADEEFTNGEAYRVIHFKDHDVYIRQNGYYNSYESLAEYDDHDYDVVTPYEKTVIDYKKVDE
jgi:hypothetical protein